MELQEILLSKDIVSSINNNLDYLLSIIPELKFMMGFEHKHPHHHLDVWNHTLLALSLSCNDFDVRLVLLLHDIGKPFSYQDGEVRHFKNHANISSIISRKILTRLNYDEDYIKTICYLIEKHDTPITDEQIANDYNLCLKLYEIQKCDALAHHPDKLEKRKKYIEETHKKLLLEKWLSSKWNQFEEIDVPILTFSGSKEVDYYLQLELLKDKAINCNNFESKINNNQK